MNLSKIISGVRFSSTVKNHLLHFFKPSFPTLNCYIVICWFMQKYTYICWIYTDAIIIKTPDDKNARINDTHRKTQEDFFIKYFTSHLRKGCSKFAFERELGTEHYWNILTPKFWPSVLWLSRSPWLLNRSTSFPYYNSSTSSTHLACLHWLVEPNWPELNCPLFNSSALYYLQTPTRWYRHASATPSDV